jgi:hypothetical protein
MGCRSAALQKNFAPNHEGNAEISLMAGKVMRLTPSTTLYYSETAGILLFFESSNHAVYVCLSVCYTINPLKMKRILSNIKTQGVPRSKHPPPQFKKPII